MDQGPDTPRGPDNLYRSTMHGEQPTRPDRLPDRLPAFRPLDPTNRPIALKRYDVPARALARTVRRSTLPATAVLSGQRGALSTLDEELLGTLLHLAAGVTRVAYTPAGEPTWFRTSMSAGNLHPVELYVVGDGVWHYQPLEHALVPLRAPLAPSGSDGPATVGRSGSATLVLTGIPFRTCWKYGERGWRHLWWDAGCLLANLLAAADAHGVRARIETAFADEQVTALVGIDGVDEVPLALLHLGPDHVLPSIATMTMVTACSEPIARDVLRFPLVLEAQRDSALDEGEVGAWRDRAAAARRPAPERIEPPSRATHDDSMEGDRIEDVILRRGSTRVFRAEQGPPDLLGWGLGAATRDAPFDGAPPGTLLEHFVNVHGIPGLDPGGYRYGAGTEYEGRTRSTDARAYGARLCLDQPLGGDSAYTVFHAATMPTLLSQLGGRAYRVVLLEAGLVAGRLSLDAAALGCGATGLTFYDGLVARYFRTEASPLLATAVGMPATEPAPSGTPGSPVELSGYPQVMARLASRLVRGRIGDANLR
jgi:SagB-type dehydrogenase family enzyme